MDITTLLATFGVPAQYVGAAATIVGVASAIATAVPAPTTASGKTYGAFYVVLNFVALNLGHARNAPTSAPTVK